MKTWADNSGAVLYEDDTKSGEVIVITCKATAAGQVTVPVYVCCKTRTGTEHVFKETVNIVVNVTN